MTDDPSIENPRLNRVGVDGCTIAVPVERMNGVAKILNCRATFMLSVDFDEPSSPNADRMCRDLETYFVQNAVTFGSMNRFLQGQRSACKAIEGFLKVSCHYPIYSKGGAREAFVSSMETVLIRNLLRSYISVLLSNLGTAWIRVTVEFSPETVIHVEEIVALANEVFTKKSRKLGHVVRDLATQIERFNRVRDYLILCNQDKSRYGVVVQKWKGIPGGLRPTAGLERHISDM